LPDLGAGGTRFTTGFRGVGFFGATGVFVDAALLRSAVGTFVDAARFCNFGEGFFRGLVSTVFNILIGSLVRN
jgi:hypothetical protein